MKKKRKNKVIKPPYYQIVGERVLELENQYEENPTNCAIQEQIEQLINQLDFEQVLQMDEYIQKILKKNCKNENFLI